MCPGGFRSGALCCERFCLRRSYPALIELGFCSDFALGWLLPLLVSGSVFFRWSAQIRLSSLQSRKAEAETIGAHDGAHARQTRIVQRHDRGRPATSSPITRSLFPPYSRSTVRSLCPVLGSLSCSVARKCPWRPGGHLAPIRLAAFPKRQLSRYLYGR